ncbi:MAG TPA: PAS domain S-box protein [Rhodospirillales bacterium]|nr:PAS domain S-box protein [Rhodospirillales bacterium]
MDLIFLSSSIDRSAAYSGLYDPKLVILSYVIACVASFCALTILKNNLSHEENPKGRMLWQTIGSVAIGIGIWSMHFIGMLAFSLPVPIAYDPLITTLSVLPAIFAGWIVLKLLGRAGPGLSRLAIGGLLMGAGIGLMHYVGMAGMIVDARMYYDPLLFAASVFVAVILSFASLYFLYFVQERWRHQVLLKRIAGPLIMGAAIATMHYTGMAATFFFENGNAFHDLEYYHPTVFGVAVGVASLVVISLTALAGFLDYRYQAAARFASTSQRILDRLLENTGQGYWYVNNDAVTIDINPAMCRILDRSPEQIIGRSIDDFTDSGNQDIFEERAEKREQGEAEHHEVDLRRQDGTLIPCIVNATDIYDDRGQRNGSVWLLTDITELKERERQSRIREERIKTVLNNLITGVVLIDEKGIVQLFNKFCENMFAYKAQEVIGKNVSMLMPEPHQSRHNGYLAAYSDSGTHRILGVGDRELFATRKDGTEFPIELGVNGVTMGGKMMFIGVIVDITKRKNDEIRRMELEQELVQASKLEAVGQLAGGIAHEINTPAQYIGDNLKFLTDAHKDLFSLLEKSLALTEAARGHGDLSALAGEIDAVREDIDLDYLREEIPSATEQSLSGIGQVSRIVLAMKEFSHPGTKEMSLADINQALKNTITISSNEWKHVAEVTTMFDETLPAVSCFVGEMNQVFLNLIVNAAHAIADKPGRSGLGQIGISTRADGEDVIIRVEDDGAGIPEDVQGHIFNPFFTTKEVGKGTGQGLSITRDIVVKRHGGAITFDTKAGKGTTFIVRLPINLAEPAKSSGSIVGDANGISGTEA